MFGRWVSLLAPFCLLSCGADNEARTGPCTGAQTRCFEGTFQRCEDAHFRDDRNCALTSHAAGACDHQLGCVECVPGQAACVAGDELHECNPDGTLGNYVRTCPEPCKNGICEDRCAMATATRSYIGCEYWPVDL